MVMEGSYPVRPFPLGSLIFPHTATDIHLNSMNSDMQFKSIQPSDEVVLATKRMTLRPFNDSRGYFLELENGEGMQIRHEDLDELLYKYFKENF